MPHALVGVPEGGERLNDESQSEEMRGTTRTQEQAEGERRKSSDELTERSHGQRRGRERRANRDGGQTLGTAVPSPPYRGEALRQLRLVRPRGGRHVRC
ncbi:hypothetical protein CR513_14470, partial [Mucuna pruriens]